MRSVACELWALISSARLSLAKVSSSWASAASAAALDDVLSNVRREQVVADDPIDHRADVAFCQ
jgi:hypothetical protein